MRPLLEPLEVALAVALVFLFLAAPPLANAAMYKWVDETGSLTYSNAPPTDPAKVTDLVTVDDIKPSSPDPVRARPETPAPKAEAAAKPEPAAVKSEAVAKPEAQAPKPETVAKPDVLRPDAVQDPCLRSPDPQCYQRNKDKYHPYLGYAPGSVRPPAAVGATGGTVGRQVIEGPAVTPAQPGAPAVHLKSRQP